MTCRDCIHHGPCAELLDCETNVTPNWRESYFNNCDYFEEASTDTSEDTAAESTMDDYAALLVKLYAEYTKSTGYTFDDYAKAVAIAIRMLSD